MDGGIRGEDPAASLLAIPHNGNLSNGRMFALIEPFAGEPSSTRNRPHERAEAGSRCYEATQMKGDGESHPVALARTTSSRELRDLGQAATSTARCAKKPDMLQYEYAREALKNGLKLEAGARRQPVQVRHGRPAPTRTPALTAVEEDNFFGKHRRRRAARRTAGSDVVIEARRSGVTMHGWQTTARRLRGGLGHRRTRARRSVGRDEAASETYAHHRARAWSVRFFGGWDFSAGRRASRIAGRCRLRQGRADGRRPAGRAGRQGADLPGRRAEGPDRAATSTASRSSRAGSTPPASRRRRSTTWSGAAAAAPSGDGKLPPVGNTVDVAHATWTNTIGAPELIARVEGSRLRPDAARLLLRARASRSRRRAGRPTTPTRFGVKMTDDVPMTHAGARLHLADLVHAREVVESVGTSVFESGSIAH
ncbi:MAG: DUF3604 domain-containing protein [Chromatiales bacterium]|nr:DUF3604 domain-containing protein [Chromatiales bacterium]